NAKDSFSNSLLLGTTIICSSILLICYTIPYPLLLINFITSCGLKPVVRWSPMMRVGTDITSYSCNFSMSFSASYSSNSRSVSAKRNFFKFKQGVHPRLVNNIALLIIHHPSIDNVKLCRQELIVNYPAYALINLLRFTHYAVSIFIKLLSCICSVLIV